MLNLIEFLKAPVDFSTGAFYRGVLFILELNIPN